MSLVKVEREKAGMTQAEVSRLTNIPEATISKIEHGKRKLTVDNVRALAKAFGCAPSALIPPLDDIEEPAHVG